MKRPSLALLVVSLVSLWSSAAFAHIKLRSPVSRDPNNVQKFAPCGPSGMLPRGSSMMVLEPGAKLTVMWDETIQHPGHYRIAFDTDGQDFPDPESFTDIGTTGQDLGNGVTILLDGIADKDGPRIGNTPYTAEVTLPDVECENCTLQLIQVMTDKEPYGDGDDIYHECGNIVLRRAGGAGGTGAAGAAAAGSGAAGAGGTLAAGSGGAAGVAAGSGAAGAAAGRGAAGAPSTGGAAGAVAGSGTAGSGTAGAASGAAGSIGMMGSGLSAAGTGPIVDEGPLVVPPPSSDGGGCHVAAVGGRGVAPGFGVLGIALAALGWGSSSRFRRRRERSRRA